MAPADKKPTAKELSLQIFEVIRGGGDFEELASLFEEDLVMEWPQSHELVRGGANAMAIMENWPGGSVRDQEGFEFVSASDEKFVMTPMFTVVKLEGSPEKATSVVKIHYPDNSTWYDIQTVTARDGKVTRVVDYFCPVYDAPEWRSKWVEPMGQEAPVARIAQPPESGGAQ